MSLKTVDNQISTEEREPDNQAKLARELIRRALDEMRPSGFKPVGYAVVMYFEGNFTQEGTIVCDSQLKGVGMNFASDGLKALLSHTGAKYGKTSKVKKTIG